MISRYQEKKTLNIVIYNITPAGGVERVAVNLANTLADAFEVHIVSLYSKTGSPFYPLDERVKLIHLGVEFSPGLKNYVPQNIETFKALKSQVSFDAQTITVGMSVNVNAVLALLKKSGVQGRFIGCEHMNYDEAVGLAQMTRRLTYPLLDDVVVLTAAEQKVFKDRLNIDAKVIPNALPIMTAIPASLESRRLIAVGRYTNQKGFDRLIPAIGDVMRRHEDWSLDIFGKGEQEADLRHLILREGVNNIRLQPPTSSIEQEYLASSIYLLPSRFEALPMVVLEAQSCGLPVVAYDSSNGPRALISSENGVLVEDGNGPAFAAAIERLMTDTAYRRQLGHNARLSAQAYAPERIRQEWLKLFGVHDSFVLGSGQESSGAVTAKAQQARENYTLTRKPLPPNPRVTVAIPMFNAEAYIGAAIGSVLAQSYSNWELLILDDGSTDRSLEIVRKFQDPRIRILSDGENRGLSRRLNESVQLASGEVYARMDADDLMVTTRMERQINYLLSHPDCDVVGSSAYIIDGDNNLTGLRGGNPFVENGFLSVAHRGGFIHPTVTGRTAWFRAHPYDINADRCEDIELWLRTADESHFGQLEEPLLFYREAGDQSAKVEKTSAGYRKMLGAMSQTAKPEYRPLLQKQLRQAHVKIWIRRLAHRLGLEQRIVVARSQPLTEDQRRAGEAALRQALAGPQQEPRREQTP